MLSSADLHRQKQLQKLKKLMKKEKKKKVDGNVDSLKPSSSNSISIPYPGSYSSSINSIHPPLYSSNEDDLYSTSTPSSSLTTSYGVPATTKSTQTAISNLNLHINSVATQTEDELNCCCTNGSKTSDIKMQYNNYNHDYYYDDCDKNYYRKNVDQASMENSREHVKKGELLLQAIERTAIINSSLMLTNNNNNNNNNNNINSNKLSSDMSKCERSECDKLNNLDLGDCRLCKRQKTKHNYNNSNNNNNSSTSSIKNSFSEEDDCDDGLHLAAEVSFK